MRKSTASATRLLGLSVILSLGLSSGPLSAQEDLQLLWQHDTGG